MSRIVIFTGPSISHAEAGAVLPAEYRPPIKRGDIAALLSNPPTIIGIIDGQFFQNMSISPKEVLQALRAGVTIYGSSSMGALRATELWRYGMIGVGKVFQMYKSGQVDADDEVAMVYAPEGFHPLSVPMVNVRYALKAAEDEHIVTARERNRILKSAKSLYFPQRTYRRILALAESYLEPEKKRVLYDYLSERAPNLKKLDAIELLHTIRPVR